MLVVTRGPNTGSQFTLEHVITTAGRHPDSDIFLDDVTVSRRHVEIERTKAGSVVRDVGSLNGTYLNQQRIEGDAAMANGDELQVGKFKLVFVAGIGEELTMTDDDRHLSIGEVLSLLQEEFPDVTISKIRFLESQGLIDPERTPSGYRKFYEADIDRLRWILVQQREHFLPLKVIKDRLDRPRGRPGATRRCRRPPSHPRLRRPTATADAAGRRRPGPRRTTAPPLPSRRCRRRHRVAAAGTAVDRDRCEPDSQPIWMVDLARATAANKATAAASEAQLPLHIQNATTEVSLTAQELAAAADLSRDALRELEQYGLLAGRPLGDAVFYDGDALLIATKAAGFLRRGVEPRHLRMFKVAADREAGFLEQLAMPLLKQRNPQARRDAVDLVEELSSPRRRPAVGAAALQPAPPPRPGLDGGPPVARCGPPSCSPDPQSSDRRAPAPRRGHQRRPPRWRDPRRRAQGLGGVPVRPGPASSPCPRGWSCWPSPPTTAPPAAPGWSRTSTGRWRASTWCS